MTSPPQTDLMRRVAALERAIAAGEGLFDQAALDRAGSITVRAHDRLRHGSDLTIVAFAGATGSGKSSLFNGVVGDEIAPTGVTRPTTSHARAAIFGEEVPGELLDWLGVRQRHGVAAADLDGLVLLDLPDHDSVQSDHRLEVDRLVELVDLMVWVLDPQKYADEALHDGYLTPLSGHAGSMVFALNHADTVAAADRSRWRAHAIEVLQADGIAGPIVVETSARTGEGLPEIREILQERIAARDAALVRLGADVAQQARRLGAVPRPELDRRDRHADALARSVALAAGGQLVAGAVADGYRFDATRATGWPFSRWLLRFRRHPLLRLRQPPQQSSTAPATPTAIPVDRPQLEMALRTYADGRAGEVPPRWTRRVRDAASGRQDELMAALGSEITGIAAASVKRPRWWAAFAWIQRLLAAAAVGGAMWLAVLAVLGYLQVPTDEITPHVGAWPVPTLLLLGGAGAGLLLSWLTRIPIGVGARRRAGNAHTALGTGLAAVAAEFVVGPVDAELDRWSRLAADLDLAAGA